MRQKNRFEPFPKKALKKFGAGPVREMTVVAPDPLFEMPGVRAVLKHAFVVIRLEDQHPASFEVLVHQPGGDSEVGGDPDPALLGFDNEADRGCGIMRYGEDFHLQIPEGQDIAGVEHPQCGELADPGQCRMSFGVDMNRQSESTGHGPEASAVVAVFVSNQQPVQMLSGHADPVEASRQFPGGKTGIDQQAALSALYIYGVTLASARQQTNPQNPLLPCPSVSAVFIPEIRMPCKGKGQT
jgi:hypothetical protein